jgi:hypothetical protein
MQPEEQVLLSARHPLIVFVAPLILILSGIALVLSWGILGWIASLAGAAWLIERAVVASTNSLSLTTTRG